MTLSDVAPPPLLDGIKSRQSTGDACAAASLCCLWKAMSGNPNELEHHHPKTLHAGKAGEAEGYCSGQHSPAAV